MRRLQRPGCLCRAFRRPLISASGALDPAAIRTDPGIVITSSSWPDPGSDRFECAQAAQRGGQASGGVLQGAANNHRVL